MGVRMELWVCNGSVLWRFQFPVSWLEKLYFLVSQLLLCPDNHKHLHVLYGKDLGGSLRGSGAINEREHNKREQNDE